MVVYEALMRMDHEGEDCIAVGSTGTLLSLMGKEMEILQARRSCSVSYDSYKKSPSARDPNNNIASFNNNCSIFGYSPASPLLNNPPASATNIVSALWSDLKGLLIKSPTNSIIYCTKDHHQQQLDIINYNDHALSTNKFPPSESQASPLRPLSHPSPLRTPSHYPSPLNTRLAAHYPKNGVSQFYSHLAPASPIRSPHIFPKEPSPAVFLSCPSQKASMGSYPKEKVAPTEAISYSNQKSSLDLIKDTADYPHGESPLHNCSKERSLAVPGAAENYPINRLHYDHSQERSDIAYANQKVTDVYQVAPTGINQESRKGNRPPAKERSLAGADAAKHYPKGKNMDAASPSLQHPKAKANMDAIYSYANMMRRSTASADAHSQSSKLLRELELAKEGKRISRNSCSRKREERAMSTCSNMLQDETSSCTQKREEKGCMQKREERERERMQNEYSRRQMRREESVCCMQAGCCICMQKPMLEEYDASSPSPCFKPSRSFGAGRLVSVVDLQCCHTPDPSSRRLSFTRLSSF